MRYLLDVLWGTCMLMCLFILTIAAVSAPAWVGYLAYKVAALITPNQDIKTAFATFIGYFVLIALNVGLRRKDGTEYFEYFP